MEVSASTRGDGTRSMRFACRLGAAACAIAAFLLSASLARAVEAIQVKPDLDKIDITAKGELYEGRGDRLQIETAPGPDGYSGRMAV